MAIKKKLVCFKKQANFEERLNAGDISDYSIVFIKDTQKIWTHGVYFSSLKEVMEKLGELPTSDTTYSLALEGNKLKLTPSEGEPTEIDLSAYLDNTDTKNTAGATPTTEKRYIVGAVDQTENPETNTSGAYIEGDKVYDARGNALATEDSVEGIKNSINELRRELELTATPVTAYCFMVRNYGDADPTAKEFIGSQENIRNVARHFKMAAIRKQGDYDILADNRITLSADGRPITIDGSDGDIMCATDTKIYLYAEKIEASDGALEIFGVGLVPLTLFGKEAVGYDPFAMACDAATYARLTTTNTDHIAEDDARTQLHCIYNTNINGQYGAPRGYFKKTYKANGAGYVPGNYTTLSSILHAQAKNEDPDSNYPYLGLYYRFVEIWMAAAKCELGTMDISAVNLLGPGATSTSIATAATWDDEAITAGSGCKIMTRNGEVKGVVNLTQNAVKVTTTGSAEAVTFGLDSTAYNCSLLPALTPHRVIDGIAANNNIGYIGNHNNVFNEDGTLARGVNVTTGEGMEEAKRYYIVRGVPGAESFADGVMTGVVNCYIKQAFNDGIYYSDNTSLSGGQAIFKISTLLYRGFTWSTGHWIQMQGFHNVIHTEANGTRYATCIYQRDPRKLRPWKSGQTHYGLDANGDTDYEKGYTKDDTRLSYASFYAKNSNPSVSLFHYPEQGGDQHTHVCAATWRNNSASGNTSAGYRSVNASSFGGAGLYAIASAGTLDGQHSVSYMYTHYAASFAILDYTKVPEN